MGICTDPVIDQARVAGFKELEKGTRMELVCKLWWYEQTRWASGTIERDSEPALGVKPSWSGKLTECFAGVTAGEWDVEIVRGQFQYPGGGFEGGDMSITINTHDDWAFDGRISQTSESGVIEGGFPHSRSGSSYLGLGPDQLYTLTTMSVPLNWL